MYIYKYLSPVTCYVSPDPSSVLFHLIWKSQKSKWCGCRWFMDRVKLNYSVTPRETNIATYRLKKPKDQFCENPSFKRNKLGLLGWSKLKLTHTLEDCHNAKKHCFINNGRKWNNIEILPCPFVLLFVFLHSCIKKSVWSKYRLMLTYCHVVGKRDVSFKIYIVL